MTHEQLIELLGAYALDAVDDDERVAIEEHLRTCPRCRAEVQEHREVATLLAHSGADAPVGLWDRIVGSLDAAPPPLELAPVLPIAPVRRRWVPAAAVAVAAALIVAVLGVDLHHQTRRIDRLQAAVADPMATAFDRALDDPSSRVVTLSGARDVRAVITAKGIGYLRATGLPRLGADRTYQLWGKVGDQLVSLGVLGNEPTVVAFGAQSVTLLAITTELAGGVVSTQQQPLVSGTLS